MINVIGEINMKQRIEGNYLIIKVRYLSTTSYLNTIRNMESVSQNLLSSESCLLYNDFQS